MRNERGFIALIAIIVLATGALAFSLATMSGAVAYSDAAYRRELRIQARLNAQACLDSVSLMTGKDYFLSGQVELKEFGCIANVGNDSAGHFHIDAKSTLNDVSWRDSRDIYIQWI